MDDLVGLVTLPSVSAGLQLHTFVAIEGCDGKTVRGCMGAWLLARASSMGAHALTPASPPQCWVLDFLPEDPSSPATALTLLSGGRVAGKTRRSEWSVCVCMCACGCAWNMCRGLSKTSTGGVMQAYICLQ
jgi:hypothetical protein